MLTLLSLSLAHAASDGSIQASPAPGSFDCGQCHNQTGQFMDLAPEEARPDIRLELTDGGEAGTLAVGEGRRLRLTVDSAFPGEEGRRMGFAMAVVAQAPGDAWTRTAALRSDDARTRAPEVQPSDLNHAAPIAFSDGRVALDLELVPEVAGDHLVYVVVNQVDGDGEPSTGDYVWPQRFCFTVEEPGGAAGEECDGPLGVAQAADSGVADSGAEGAPGEGTCAAAGGGAGWLAWAGLALCGRRQKAG